MYRPPQVPLVGGGPVQQSWAREFDDDMAYEEMVARDLIEKKQLVSCTVYCFCGGGEHPEAIEAKRCLKICVRLADTPSRTNSSRTE